MYLIYCVDEKGGLSFGGRRQSRDRTVRGDMLEMTAGKTLWMDETSRRQFTEPEGERIRVEISADDSARMTGNKSAILVYYEHTRRAVSVR